MDAYSHLKDLGKGSYGKVSLVIDERTGRKVFCVLKSVSLSDCKPRDRRYAELEAKLLATLRHPNIVRYKDSFEIPGGILCVVMEYCEGGDLHSYIRCRGGNLMAELLILDFFVQICMALEYIHDRNILHRDLKTQNVFLTKNDVIKIGDFGIAKILDSHVDMATTLVGTPYYMSPEIFARQPYNHKSDVWALGLVAFELCTLKHAFDAKDLPTLISQVLGAKIPPLPERYSADLKKIVTSMLHSNPEKRPSASKILRHPLIKSHLVEFLKTTGKQLNSIFANANEDLNSNQVFTDIAEGTEASRKRKRSRIAIIKDRSRDSFEEVDEIETASARSRRALSADQPRAGRTSVDARSVVSAKAAVDSDRLPNISNSTAGAYVAKFSRRNPDIEQLSNAVQYALSIRKSEHPRKSYALHFDGGNDEFISRRRFATLRRQATVKVDQNIQETAFKIIEKCEGIGTETALQKLLGNDYETAAPLLHQLFFYDRAGGQQQ